VQLDYDEIIKDPELRLELAKGIRDIINVSREELRYLLLGDNDSRKIPLGKGEGAKKMEKELEKVNTTLTERQKALAALYQDDLEWLENQEKTKQEK
jgi:hypothetical protein